MTNPTPADVERLIADAQLALKIMAETNTFPTGQGVIVDLIAALRAMQAERANLRRERDAEANGVTLLLKERDAAEAKLAEVEKERDGLLTTWAESRERHLAAEATVATLTAQVEAMRPVVAQLAALPIGPATADDVPLYGLDGVYITYGHVRAARAALTTENDNG